MSPLTLHVLVVTEDASFLKEVSSAFEGALPGATWESCSFHDAFRERHKKPAFILVDAHQPSELFAAFVERACDVYPDAKVVSGGHPSDVALVLRFVKMGIKDFLSRPLVAEEIKALTRSASEEVRRQSGKVVMLYSPKGGVGVTFLAANLAYSLQVELGSRTVLWEAARGGGPAASYLNLRPTYTIRDALDGNPLLDASLVEGVLIRHVSGMRLLAAPRDDQDDARIDEIDSVVSVLTALRSSADAIVIDAGRADPVLVHALAEKCDAFFIVANPDIVSMKCAASWSKRFRSLSQMSGETHLVLNRANSRYSIDAREFEKKAGCKFTYEFPNNYFLCMESVNTGRPVLQVQSRSDLSRKISQLASRIARGRVTDPGSEPKRGLFFRTLGITRDRHAART